jgi:phytoene synthase
MNIEKRITRKSKSSFYYAFSVLPKEKREAIYILYSFCRQTDDIADSKESSFKKQKTLDFWEKELFKQFNGINDTRFIKLWNIADKFRIPLDYFAELIKGVRMDLLHVRFESIDDLITYCYRVASIVGLMSIQIFGYKDERVKDYAVNLGIALQLTNIMRDVGVDADMNRVYLPLEDLHKFGISEKAILEKQNNDAFFNLMEYQYDRALSYYQKADKILPRTERRNMIPSQIMKNIYFHLLTNLKRNSFNVLHQKLEIPSFMKLYIAFKTLLSESLILT